MTSVEQVLEAVEHAVQSGRLDGTAAGNLRQWLREPIYASQQGEITRLVERGDFDELQDAFGGVIPFGTGGRRGAVGPGPNRINVRTIAESAQGLSRYVLMATGGPTGRAGESAAGKAGTSPSGAGKAGVSPSGAGTSTGAGHPPRIVIAYDTRKNSLEFAEVAAAVIAANGIEAVLFEGPRSTPELSFAVRHLEASAGIVISASHNPPKDNGFKAYWADGGQVVPPHDQAIIEEVVRVRDIPVLELGEAERRGLLRKVGGDVDRAYASYTAGLSLCADRGVGIIFTPLHGTGTTSVAPALAAAGFKDVRFVSGQWEPDPGFSGVPGHSPNPENPAALDAALEQAKASGADLVLGSDPDADRLGAVVRHGGKWVFLTGNRIAVLLFEHVARTLASSGSIPPGGVLMKTCVTSDLLDRIAEAHGITVLGDYLVGFKYIAEAIGQLPDPSAFVFGTEESHGYLRGAAVRDKDAAQAAVLLAEMTAAQKARGLTLIDALEEIWSRYGYYVELTRSIPLQGKGSGAALGARIMDTLRASPPRTIAGERVLAVADRKSETIVDPSTGGALGRTRGAPGNLLVFHLQAGGAERISIRPSGTEPKIKMYVQIRGQASALQSASQAGRADADARAMRLAADFEEIARRA